ncbi:hypothetical protein PHYPSEUDO_003815 [Phytophthora pseudosyringae]|uniref:Uncharacterized protein n=1 Tax=Phytophthora pseudosyringae TaxID=221518 RepID=A0A8T1WI16_9STRA|nr:hypothetical protein PHYPSEUDO_003815 [Phytophthora pseudosyringae]
MRDNGVIEAVVALFIKPYLCQSSGISVVLQQTLFVVVWCDRLFLGGLKQRCLNLSNAFAEEPFTLAVLSHGLTSQSTRIRSLLAGFDSSSFLLTSILIVSHAHDAQMPTRPASRPCLRRNLAQQEEYGEYRHASSPMQHVSDPRYSRLVDYDS